MCIREGIYHSESALYRFFYLFIIIFILSAGTLSAICCTILFNTEYFKFPDGELGLRERPVTIEELLTHEIMLWVFRNRIHFPKHRFYLTYQTSNQISLCMNRRHWELLTDYSCNTNPDANIHSNTVIFSPSHNKYLSFYANNISQKQGNMPGKYLFTHCIVWIKGIIKGSHHKKSNVSWSLRQNISVFYENIL